MTYRHQRPAGRFETTPMAKHTQQIHISCVRATPEEHAYWLDECERQGMTARGLFRRHMRIAMRLRELQANGGRLLLEEPDGTVTQLELI